MNILSLRCPFKESGQLGFEREREVCSGDINLEFFDM